MALDHAAQPRVISVYCLDKFISPARTPVTVTLIEDVISTVSVVEAVMAGVVVVEVTTFVVVVMIFKYKEVVMFLIVIVAIL